MSIIRANTMCPGPTGVEGRHRLVQWLAEIESLKQLTYHIVRMKMQGLDVTREISMGKLLSGQLITKVADGCLQMFGGMGLMN